MRFIMYSSNFILTKNQISIIYFIFIFFLFPMFDSNSKELVQSEKNFKKDFEIAAECLALFPNILYNFFDRRTCVEENIKMRDLEVEKENLVKFRKLREERARTCIIDDFERFEKIFFSVRHALRQEFEKDEEDKEFKRTKTILADILKHNNFDISVPEDNANFRLLKFEIPTICDSEFKFTGLLFFTNGVLGYLRFFPSYIPNGNSDFIEKYNNTVVENFIQERGDRATLKIQIEIEKNKLEKKMNRLNQIADFNRSGYIYENNNRCRIWIDKLFPEYEIFWTGECDSDGLVYGKGKVKISYLKDNVKFNSTIDAVYFEGVISDGFAQIDNDDFIYKGNIKDTLMNGDGIIYFKSSDHVYRGNFLNGMPDGKYANFGKLGYQKIEFFKGDVVSAKSGCIFDRNFQVLGVFSNQNLSINKCYEIIRKN